MVGDFVGTRDGLVEGLYVGQDVGVGDVGTNDGLGDGASVSTVNTMFT